MVTEAAVRRARIGVVGCGSWSNEAHLPALAARSDAEVVALADPSASRRSETATRFGVEATFATHEQMYDSCELDGVIVATPHSTHYEIAHAGIAHGAHVLVEKPMVLDPADARSLLDAARRERREVIVGYPWHFNRHTLELREVLRSGDLGTIEFVTCLFASSVREYYRGAADAYRDVLPYVVHPEVATYSDPALAGGGQGQTQLTHSAALVLFLLGTSARRVGGACESFELAVDLADSLWARLEQGALASFASTGSKLPGGGDILELRIFGARGHVLFDVGGGTASVTLEGRTRELEPLSELERYPQYAPAGNLVDVCLGLGANGSPGDVGLATVDLVSAMYRSAGQGGVPVEIAATG